MNNQNAQKPDERKLLEGLANPAAGITVSVRRLAQYMGSHAVMVDATVGRKRGRIPLPGKAYGLDKGGLSEEAGTFYGARVSEGHLSFIPKQMEAELGAIEKRLRRAITARTLADGFIPVSAYASLKEEYLTLREAYFRKRDEILSQWDELLDSFHMGAKALLDSVALPSDAREQMMREFVQALPSKEEYQESFSMTLQVKAFPAEAPTAGLDASIAMDVRETWKEEVVSTAILSIEKMVGEGWDLLNRAVSQYIHGGAIKAKTLECIKKFQRDLSWKNLFSNPLLKGLEKRLVKLSSGSADVEGDVEVVEACVLDIYAYAKETHLNLSFEKSAYSEEQMEQMLQFSGLIQKN